MCSYVFFSTCARFALIDRPPFSHGRNNWYQSIQAFPIDQWFSSGLSKPASSGSRSETLGDAADQVSRSAKMTCASTNTDKGLPKELPRPKDSLAEEIDHLKGQKPSVGRL